MSEGQLPAYVDIRKVFLQEAKVGGQVDLSRLPRFQEILYGEDASIECDLAFIINRQGQRQITGQVTASGQLACERCLEPVAIELHEQIRLILLDSEPEAAALEPDWDPWLCSEYKLQLAELVEEQLILALPIVNLHADKDCIQQLEYSQAAILPAKDEAGDEDNESPFAVLEQLKNAQTLKKSGDKND